MTTDDKKNRYNVPGLERGLAVLASFTRETPELEPRELTEQLALPRTTVFRLLQTLESLGYVVRSTDGNRYRLGASILRLGFEYLASQDVVDVGRPLVDGLSLDAGLPAHLVIRDGRSIVYAVCAKPRAKLVGTVTVGTSLPAHATVFGRILLGGVSLDKLRALFPEEQLEHATGQTPDTAESLHELIEADFERGFGISEGFYEPRISTIAAPVRDHDGQITAAVGLTITDNHIEPALLADGVVEQVVTAAGAIADNLGYHGDAYQHARRNAQALQAERAEVAS